MPAIIPPTLTELSSFPSPSSISLGSTSSIQHPPNTASSDVPPPTWVQSSLNATGTAQSVFSLAAHDDSTPVSMLPAEALSTFLTKVRQDHPHITIETKESVADAANASTAVTISNALCETCTQTAQAMAQKYEETLNSTAMGPDNDGANGTAQTAGKEEFSAADAGTVVGWALGVPFGAAIVGGLLLWCKKKHEMNKSSPRHT